METRAYVAEGTKVSSVSEMREKCSPTDCLARMILGEAGNQPQNEMIAGGWRPVQWHKIRGSIKPDLTFCMVNLLKCCKNLHFKNKPDWSLSLV